MDDGAINPAAARGFERGAAAYESARPSYPAAAVAWLVDVAELDAGRSVLDLAAGTGKLTRLLLASGADVVAVEPVAAMRETLAEVCPGVQVSDGTAEAIPLSDGSVDAVTVAQAFHWFDAAAALAEIHRVLRPGGCLVLVWNARDERVDWVHRFTELIVARAGGRPYTPFANADLSVPTGATLTVDHERVIAESGLFRPLGSITVANPQDVTPEDVVDRAASTSFVAELEDRARLALLDEVRTLVATHPETAGRDRFVFPHETFVAAYRAI